MRPLKALPALAALLLAPGQATAQPTVYVCTPAAQVVAVDATTKAAAVIYNGSGTFSDCALGPDGRLYVANGSQVLRFDPQNALRTHETVAALTSAARGLSFNVTTLYVSTAVSGLWAFQGMSEAPQGGPFPRAPPPKPLRSGPDKEPRLRSMARYGSSRGRPCDGRFLRTITSASLVSTA